MMAIDKSEFVEQKFDELRKLLDLVDVVEQMEKQFPDDNDVVIEAQKARAKRLVCIHNVFVDIMGIYGDVVDFKLIDLMEQNFEANDDSDEVDRRVEEYFGNLNKQRKKIKIKRRDSK